MANCFLRESDSVAGMSADMLNLSPFPIARPLPLESTVPFVLWCRLLNVVQGTEVNLFAKLLSRLIDASIMT